jgi:hypothetical protein
VPSTSGFQGHRLTGLDYPGSYTYVRCGVKKGIIS